MLEVGQPGELPLMRELTALKKTKGLRDPSTTTSSRKSPVLETVSLTTTELNPSRPDGHEETAMKKELGLGGSGRRDGIRGTTPRRKGSFRSPQLGDVDTRLSWDLGREAFLGMDAAGPADFHQHREDFKNHLEKLGILGDSRGLGKQMVGGKSILHNWRPVTAAAAADDDDDGVDEGGIEGPLVADRSEQEASPDMQNWPEAIRDCTSTHHEFLAYQDGVLGRDGFGRVKASQKTSRTTKAQRLSRQSAQILSPLVLNCHDDLHKFSQSKSLFTLEEPYDEEEQYFKEETGSGLASVHKEAAACKMGWRSHSPLAPPQARRSSRKQTMNTNSRPSQMFFDINSQVGRSSSRLGPREAEFLEYDIDSVEMSKKDSGKSHHRSKHHNGPKYLSAGQETMLSPDPRKTTRRKGGLVLEQQSMLQQFTSASYPSMSQEAEPLPLLTELEDYNGSEEFAASSVDGDGGKLSMRELHGELELEAFNASSAKAHHAERLVKVADKESLQLAVPECKELALCDYKPRNLSQKYRPKVFEEVVGQNIVTQALSNAILRGKIAPVYLFQGSRGTGKTTSARIFAAALICISPEERRPCGACRECSSVATGNCSEVKEVDAASNNGIERVKALLEETISAPPLSRYKVFIIDECHVLTTETWNALLKILEEPPMNVVFILITTDPDQLPRTAVSRCQKFPFPKIKESEIVKRLQQLAHLENLEIDIDTLQLIASQSDGSLRDAETTLDQLSLLGEQIDSSTVYELVGSASDDRMLSLLDCALLADTVGTVRRARELVDSGVEPLSLMSRLATLITDILAGSFKFTDKQRKGFFRKQTLSEEKLEWLRIAMKTLSEAEKQLRVSNDRTPWLTAALLQLGPDRSCMFPASCAGTSVTQSPVALDDVGENEAADFEHTSSGRQTWDDDANHRQNTSSEFMPSKCEIVVNNGTIHHIPVNQGNTWSTNKTNEMPSPKVQIKTLHERSMQSQASPGLPQAPEKQQFIGEDPSDDLLEDTNSGQILSSTKLDDIWCRVVERCWPLSLRELLHAHGKLVSISMSEVDAVIHLEVSHAEHKSRCERSQKSIANVFELVLGFPVEVKISLASLPAEEKPGARNQTSAEQYSLAQGSVQGGPGVSCSSDEVQSKTVATKRYSLSNCKHPGSAINRMVTYQSNASECFQAIPQASYGSSLKENQFLDQAASTWNNNMLSADSGGRPGHSKSITGARLENARAHDARRYSPLTASVSGNTNLDGARNQHFQGMPENVNGYMRGLDYDDINGVCSDGERDIDELEMLSPKPYEAATLSDKTRPRHSSMEGPLDAQSYCVDGRRSCDTDLQKKKGSSSKMVRRLTMRSRIRSLPSSDPNSPDDRGSSRFSIKRHTNSQKNKDSHLSGDGADISEQAGDSAEASNNAAAAQKRSKLKGAAGSFARFFKGSK